MYFWGIKKLKLQLITAPLTDQQTLPYLIAAAVLMALSSSLVPDSKNIWSHLGTATNGLLAVFGTVYLYCQNGGHSGINFLQRYLVISWVVMIRWLAIVFPLGVGLTILMACYDIQDTWQSAIFLSIVQVALYGRIGHHIKDVARHADVI